MAKVIEYAALALPAVQARLGTDPYGSGAVLRQGENPIIDQRVRIRRVVTPMLDVSGCRIQDVDAGIVGPDPDPTAGVHEDRVRGVAREGAGIGGIVAEDREAIAGAVPAGDTGILDRYPQIVMRILDDLVNE